MAIEQNGTYSPSERIVSPGVFTREIDQTFLAQGVAAIGGVVVAPFPKGPGFSPTVVTSEGDLETIFGAADGTLYGPVTAQQYLRQQGQVTVVRVGGLAGYNQQKALLVTAVPGQYRRFQENSVVSGSLLDATLYPNSAPDSIFWITGSVQVAFESGFYEGETLEIGTLSIKTFASSSTNLYGAVTASDGCLEYFRATASKEVGNENMPFRINGVAPWNNAHFPSGSVLTLRRIEGACDFELKIEGTLSGSYGAFNPNSFIAGVGLTEDGCGSASLASGSDSVVLAVLANSAYDRGQNLYGFSGSLLATSSATQITADFSLALNTIYTDINGNTASSSYGTYQFSLDEESNKYITSVFGTDPKAGFYTVPAGQKIEAAYTYKNFKNRTKTIVEQMLASGSWKISIATRDALQFEDGIDPSEGTSTFDLTNAYTPFIRSQLIAAFTGSGVSSSAAYDLFQVHTLTDGTSANTAYKIEISNVKSPGSVPGTSYGTFTLAVRSYSDTDLKPVYLERFDNLDLNPDSANYIARRIGDTYGYIDANGKVLEFGDYPQKSKYVRVEMATSPWPVNAIPYGFGPYATPIGGDYARLGKVPAMQYTSASIYNLQPGRYASGIVFQPAPAQADATLAALYPNGTSVGPELDNKQYFAPIPAGAAVGANVAFDLEAVCGVSPLYVASQEATNVKKRRFILGFQGGFDGQSPSIPLAIGGDISATNQQGLDCSTNTSRGTYAYKQAIAALSNADEFDFNLITTPGINYNYHPYVATAVVDMCERRGDAFYIMDIAQNQTAGATAIQNVVDLAGQFDTNYAATYYPWVKVTETNSNKIMAVPPSVVMMSVYAANDKVSAEWFAPAGLNRGGIPTAVSVADRLTHTERDTLYEGHVNPIAAFPGQGVVAWGQKTLQRNPSALDRVNVRRLLIALKKFIASSSRFLVFEQNVSTTRQRFLNIVNPYLESVQQRSGVYAFKVVMDDSNNTPDLVDRGILYGQIYIQPTRTAEMIVLDFNVLPTGATFPGA
jgi:hypothetical protein